MLLSVAKRSKFPPMNSRFQWCMTYFPFFTFGVRCFDWPLPFAPPAQAPGYAVSTSTDSTSFTSCSPSIIASILSSTVA